jgi:transcriptional regulator with XRE-family HTH domain
MHPPSDVSENADNLLEERLEQAISAVGSQIRRIRESQNRSQAAAARDAGMHRTEWGRIERGTVEPRLTSLLRIQHALQLDGLEPLFGALPSRRLLEGDH